MEIRVIGVEGVIARLDKFERRQLFGILGRATRAGGKVMVEGIKSEAPFRTGALRRSIKVTAARRDRPGAVIGPRAPHRHFVIGGTQRGVSPNPFVARGVAKTRSRALDAVREVIRREAVNG